MLPINSVRQWFADRGLRVVGRDAQRTAQRPLRFETLESRQLLATIHVGDWLVPAGETAWTIPIRATGGDRVDGINFNIQIGDGLKSHGEAGPVFAALEILQGTIFEGKSTGSWDRNVQDWIAWDWTDTDPAEAVYADGIVGYVTGNTANCPSGTWDLVMSDTLNGPTDFAGMEAVVVDGTITVTDTNQAPQLTEPIPDQTAPANRRFRFALAPDTFLDPDPGQTLTYAAAQPDGSPLPKWLAFDAQTGVFSGRPLVRDAGQFRVRVTATDSGSPRLSAWADFDITVTPHPFPFQNADLPPDVDGNDVVAPLDALIVINRLNAHGSGPVPDSWSEDNDGPFCFFDAHGDNLISPMDVLTVVNYLNAKPYSTLQDAEGEAIPTAPQARVATVSQPRAVNPVHLGNSVVDQAFGQAADLPSPTDWDELLGTLARG